MMPCFLSRDFAKALALGRRAVELNPRCTSTYKVSLATLGHPGHRREAAWVLARLLELEPGFTLRNALERSPMIRPADLALYAKGLRCAGLPDD